MGQFWGVTTPRRAPLTGKFIKTHQFYQIIYQHYGCLCWFKQINLTILLVVWDLLIFEFSCTWNLIGPKFANLWVFPMSSSVIVYWTLKGKGFLHSLLGYKYTPSYLQNRRNFNPIYNTLGAVTPRSWLREAQNPFWALKSDSWLKWPKFKMAALCLDDI